MRSRYLGVPTYLTCMANRGNRTGETRRPSERCTCEALVYKKKRKIKWFLIEGENSRFSKRASRMTREKKISGAFLKSFFFSFSDGWYSSQKEKNYVFERVTLRSVIFD